MVLRLLISIPKDLLIDRISSININIMSFLSIDCSTNLGSLFIKIKNKTYSKVLQSDKYNNDLLMKKILDFFDESNTKFDDITKIFVNQGPGGFSGLRGSLAVAKGISLSKNLNLYGYNTFIWQCVSFFNEKDFVYSLIKFRKKYYIKKFNQKLKSFPIIEEVTVSEIVKKYDNRIKTVSKNAIKDFDKKILKLKNLNIVDLDHKELEFLQLEGLLDERLIKPLYLT